MINAENIDSNSTERVKIGIMDTGINSSTSLKVEYNQEYVEEDSFIFPDLSGHGTAVAGVIASDEYGIKNNTELYSIKVMSQENIAYLSDIVNGIYWAINNNIKVLNMSFGTSKYSEALEEAVNDAAAAGILIVASAGNDGTIRYPAAFPNVIAAGSIDHNGNVMSQNGAQYTNILYAPGDSIFTVGDFETTIACSGTSMAAPHITAVAAALWERDNQKNANFIKDLLFATANSSIDGIRVLDAECASEKYTAFSAEYTESAVAPPIYLNTAPITTFDDETFEALWGGSDHSASIPSSFSGMTSAEKNILKVFSQIPDNTNVTFKNLYKKTVTAGGYSFYNYFSSTATERGTALYLTDGDSNKIIYSNDGIFLKYDGETQDEVDFDQKKILHGRQNYVASLKFLYTVAHNLWSGTYYSKTGATRRKIIRDAMKDALPTNEETGSSETFYGDSKKYGYAVAKDTNGGAFTIDTITYTDGCTAYYQQLHLQRMVYLAANCKSDTLKLTYTNMPTHYTFQREAALKVLGIALHLLGDVYAHRTVLPTKQADGSCNTSFSATTRTNATDGTTYKSTIYRYDGANNATNLFSGDRWSGTDGIQTVIKENGTVSGGAKITTRQLNYMWQSTIKGSYYEDNSTFLNTRYNFTKVAVKNMLTLFYSNDSFGTSIFKVTGVSGIKVQRIADLRRYMSFIENHLPADEKVTGEAYLKYYDSKVTVSDIYNEGKAPTNSSTAWFTLGYEHSY